jgi:hypothetical protein
VKLTKEDKRKLSALAHSEGWLLIEGLAREALTSITNRLQVERFKDLSEIARLQGEITGMERVLNYVNNRLDKERG